MNSKGFVLSELLIASALSGFLFMLVVTMYLRISLVHERQIEQQEVFESGQFVVNTVKHELRMAGFSANQSVLVHAVLPTEAVCNGNRIWMMNFSHGIDLQQDNHQSLAGVLLDNHCLTLSPVNNSDILLISRLADKPTTSDDAFVEGWYLIQKNSPMNSYFSYLTKWPDDALLEQDKLWLVDAKIFYVRNYSVKGDKIPSLVIVSPTSTAFQQQVLFEGVELMQLEWLIKNNGNYQVFRELDLIKLDMLLLARVYLVIRSQHRSQQKPSAQQFVLAQNQTLSYSADGYYRSLFVQSVLLRNRGK